MKWYCNFIEKLPYVRKFSWNPCKIDSKIMKWSCNFIENLPYVRKFLHIFWVGNLVNINFWPLTLTVFINFDGCWIMVVKNTPFFRSFSFLKFPENLKNWRISVFFIFSSSFKIFRKNGGDWPSTFWSYPCILHAILWLFFAYYMFLTNIPLHTTQQESQFFQWRFDTQCLAGCMRMFWVGRNVARVQ